MKLLRFRVQNFKSIKDSDWIEVGALSCLLGTNEAGKTNTLQGLWKLRPANAEPIIPLSDYPRKNYSAYEATNGNEKFIVADFEVEERDEPVEGAAYEIVRLSRSYDKLYMCQGLSRDLKHVRYLHGDDFQEIIKQIPKFVYFSDYGNLDSEIYLPHVIENAARTDLGERERAKARSLNVLFEYVNLKPKEILELGQETPRQTSNQYGQVTTTEPTAAQIEADREKKKKREILLTSASSRLTQAFREWWKQGDYRFRFQADGNHFRIWVSDDRRPEEVELESRSRGLQWFFSFFLVFLVESKSSHENSILLLDEPGLSLHPIAQGDLIKFFASLAQENQLIYTTHSPFLVEPNNLANIKAVYVDAAGQSTVSSNLRQGSDVAEHSIYPVHAAIGLTVSEGLLLGCQPVMVEGPSDQIYLQMIKNILSSQAKYRNDREMIFIPAGGVSGMKPIISIISGRDNALPYAILDADKPGRDKENQLRASLYKDDKDKIISVASILGEGSFEVEDLMPADELARVFSKDYRGKQTDDFDDLVDVSKPIIPQMETFASQNGYELEQGWKVDLARAFQRTSSRVIGKVSPEQVKLWKKLFDKLTSKK
ncbi:MAG: OLD family endonuclease [Hymenobacter sp.]|nr:MAG: OLD family endonuclease [Hymenobacter sp.]